MTKKQYFLLLWGVHSIIIIIIQMISFLFIGIIPIDEIGSEPIALRASTSVIMFIVATILIIIIRGFVVAIGLDFAEKINAKLLFLNGYFSFKNIFQPAIVVAIGYGVICLLVSKQGLFFNINVEQFAITEKLLPLFFSQDNGLLLVFHEIVGQILKILTNDIWSFLLIISGIALLLKSIVQDLSSSDAMKWSIILRCCYHVFMMIMTYGFSILTIIPLVQVIKNVLLGLLFWKKGFEAAVLCHLFIVVFLYLFIPSLVLVFGV